MEKRYHVFFSSIFNDLREERAACIAHSFKSIVSPQEWSYFPPADEDSLTLIKSVIDDSNYYLVILAGRYGSVEKNSGKSYTHVEYEYGQSRERQRLLWSIPSLPPSPQANARVVRKGGTALRQFRTELQRKHCKLWNNE